MNIGGHRLSQDGVYVIAEAGVNHNGSVRLAKQLVDAAVDAGANAVKFQMYETESLVTNKAGLADYQRRGGTSHTQKELLARYELTAEQFAEIKRYCDQRKIVFLATPFDLKSAEALQQMNVDAFKIGSGDLTYRPLLKRIARFRKPLILSTGMATIGEVEHALQGVFEVNRKADVALLHCTSSYPAPFHTLHLKAMQSWGLIFKRPIGYSDHSQGIEASIAAVALGACILEKHFTLSRKMDGPDHLASLEPSELKKMIRSVRNVEAALGHSVKQMTSEEEQTKLKVRRSLYIAKDLPEGHIITEQDVACLRPLDGVDVAYIEQVIGQQLVRSKRKHESLHWRDLGEEGDG